MEEEKIRYWKECTLRYESSSGKYERTIESTIQIESGILKVTEDGVAVFHFAARAMAISLLLNRR